MGAPRGKRRRAAPGLARSYTAARPGIQPEMRWVQMSPRLRTERQVALRRAAVKVFLWMAPRRSHSLGCFSLCRALADQPGALWDCDSLCSACTEQVCRL